MRLEDIGEGNNALLCFTDHPSCCDSNALNPRGEFYFPNGSLVRTPGSSDDIYRNRGHQFIRLNRRNDPISATGTYRCEIPDMNVVLQNIYITVGKYLDAITKETVISTILVANCSFCAENLLIGELLQ